MAKLCISHKDDVKAKCPSHISTRWVFDFDIINFIRTHAKRISLFTVIPDELPLLFPNLMILHSIVSTFEDTHTLLCQAYPTLRNALCAFTELVESGNPFARQFGESLRLKTLNCEEGGVWYLAYLLTRCGHNENRLNMLGQLKTPSHPYINFFHIPQFTEQEDPIEHIVDTENSDDSDPVEEDSNSEDEGEYARTEEEDREDIAPDLKKAKDFLKKQLEIMHLGAHSIDNTMAKFAWYIDEDNPFEDCKTNDVIGFSWVQIKTEYPEFKLIADLAMKLHSSPCSEASCERTISTQKLILNLRRHNSSKDLLDARLQLMRSKIKK